MSCHNCTVVRGDGVYASCWGKVSGGVGRGYGAIGLGVLCAEVLGMCSSCGAVVRAERISEMS